MRKTIIIQKTIYLIVISLIVSACCFNPPDNVDAVFYGTDYKFDKNSITFETGPFREMGKTPIDSNLAKQIIEISKSDGDGKSMHFGGAYGEIMINYKDSIVYVKPSMESDGLIEFSTFENGVFTPTKVVKNYDVDVALIAIFKKIPAAN